ncbi:porphobilinogen deaminase [Hanseniaspora vineae]
MTDTTSTSNTPAVVKIGGRRSKLAIVQSEHVKDLILNQVPDVKECTVAHMQTLGDQVQGKPLYSFGGKALWTTELEDKLRDKNLDIIVHSLKDMPTLLPDEFILGGISARVDPSDAVCMKKDSSYKTLDDLPHGSVVGTSSVRRSAQLKRFYPHLKFESVRGNLQTRLSKLDDPSTNFECIILATAGLERVNLDHRITYKLRGPVMYHAVGQGALGMEIRKDDFEMKKICDIVSDRRATVCCLAERSLMRTLEGGCSVPIGVESSFDLDSEVLKLTGCVISVDGQQYVTDSISAKITNDYNDSIECGKQLAAQLIAQGAKEILDAINLDKVQQ